MDGNGFPSLAVLPYYTSPAEVSTAAEEMEKLASEVVSILTCSIKLVITEFTVLSVDLILLSNYSILLCRLHFTSVKGLRGSGRGFSAESSV